MILVILIWNLCVDLPVWTLGDFHIPMMGWNLQCWSWVSRLRGLWAAWCYVIAILWCLGSYISSVRERERVRGFDFLPNRGSPEFRIVMFLGRLRCRITLFRILFVVHAGVFACVMLRLVRCVFVVSGCILRALAVVTYVCYSRPRTAWKNCICRRYFTSPVRGIGSSFQLAITAPQIYFIGYGTATAQSQTCQCTFTALVSKH